MRTRATGLPATCVRQRAGMHVRGRARATHVLEPPASSRRRSTSPTSRAPAPRRLPGRIRARGARRAGSSRLSPTCSRFGAGSCSRDPSFARMRRAARQADRRRLRARPLRRAGRRRRGLGPQRLLRRLPVVAARRAGPRGGVRRADEHAAEGQRALDELEDAFFERVLGSATTARAVRRAACRLRSPRLPAATRTVTERYVVEATHGRASRPSSVDDGEPSGARDRRANVRADGRRRGPRPLRLSARPGFGALRQPARRARRVIRAAVAAGHPATAEAGAEILAAGGTAADAAVAACARLVRGGDGDDRASSAAATRSTSTQAAGAVLQPRLLRRGAVRPRRADGPRCRCRSARRSSTTRSAPRPAPCPASPPGSTRSGAATGGCRGPSSSSPHSCSRGAASPCRRRTLSCLAMLEPVMTMREGAAIYAPGGVLLERGRPAPPAGARPRPRARARRGLRVRRTRGRSPTHSSRSCGERGGSITRADLARLRGRAGLEPVAQRFAGRRDAQRAAALSGVAARRWHASTSRRTATTRCSGARARAVSRRRAHDEPHRRRPARAARACSRRASASGPATSLPGLDLHLNSMLGETDLIREPLVPGARMESMMAPTLAFDDASSSSSSRSEPPAARVSAPRSSACSRPSCTTASAPQAAIDRPRFHPAGQRASTPSRASTRRGSTARGSAGASVRRWRGLHHYFGGVSAVGRAGAGADPRRSGAVARLRLEPE